MVDIVSNEVRSRMMKGIRGKKTKLELTLGSGLHNRGMRYRLHRKDLPGSPDFVFSKYRAVVLAEGCFWHGHDCHLFKWPSSREEFWTKKIKGNVRRDERNLQKLKEKGWRICRVWECSLKRKPKHHSDLVFDQCVNWLRSDRPWLEIAG